jgi:hypothetical protein
MNVARKIVGAFAIISAVLAVLIRGPQDVTNTFLWTVVWLVLVGIDRWRTSKVQPVDQRPRHQ